MRTRTTLAFLLWLSACEHAGPPPAPSTPPPPLPAPVTTPPAPAIAAPPRTETAPTPPPVEQAAEPIEPRRFGVSRAYSPWRGERPRVRVKPLAEGSR